MPTSTHDSEGYAAGRRAAAQELALTADNVVDRASKALAAYLRTRGLSFLDSAPQVVMPIAEAFSDGFLDEVLQGPRGPDEGADAGPPPDPRAEPSGGARAGPDGGTFPRARSMPTRPPHGLTAAPSCRPDFRSHGRGGQKLRLSVA